MLSSDILNSILAFALNPNNWEEKGVGVGGLPYFVKRNSCPLSYDSMIAHAPLNLFGIQHYVDCINVTQKYYVTLSSELIRFTHPVNQ